MASPHTTWSELDPSEVTFETVHTLLGPIRDDVWVAAACVDRIVDDPDVERELLTVGLKRTEGAVKRAEEAAFSGSPHPDEDKESSESLIAHFRGVPVDGQLCHMRNILLQRLDRLNTFVEICKEPPLVEDEDGEAEEEEWEDDPWADGAEAEPSQSTPNKPTISLDTFLTQPILQTAYDLATRQWFTAVRVLIRRHSESLWSHRFSVLDTVPEHSVPSTYRDLLPSFDFATESEHHDVPEPWRAEPDWTERKETRLALNACTLELGEDMEGALTIPGPNPDPLSASQLTDWYKARVNAIITSTGMIDTSLALVQHGASQGIPGLDEVGEELSLLSRLVYDAPGPDDAAEEDWTLSRWSEMSPSAVVAAYLEHTAPAAIPEKIRTLVLPYLFVLESRAERAGTPDPTIPTRLLHEYVLNAPLDIVMAIFQASVPGSPEAQRIIKTDEEIARLALACLYGSNSLDEWPTMSRIFECMPNWTTDDGADEVADTTLASLGAFVKPTTARPRCTPPDLIVFFNPLPMSSLSRALDILDVHLASGETLSRWSIPAPLRLFLQSGGSIEEQRAWANRLARRAGGSNDKLETVEDWEWLLDDMTKVSKQGENGGPYAAFGLLEEVEVVRIFLAGLLGSGLFQITKEMLHSKKNKLTLVDSATLEEICLACSREFYDNASSGNYKFGDMKLAYDCLDVIPPSDQVNKEKGFIEATSRLSSFNILSRPGIPISPLEIRLTKDRLSLVSRVLSSNFESYKHTQVILDLVDKLGFRNDIVAEVKTLAMLADAALQAEDFERAYETSERMVDTVIQLRKSTAEGVADPTTQEASEVCWVACFQLGRQPEWDETSKKLALLGRALELCPPDQLHDVLTAWRRLEKEDIEERQERLKTRRSGTAAASAPRKKLAAVNGGYSLAARLQQIQIPSLPSSPLLHAPDAAALASRTFNRVAANFPFGVGGRGRPASPFGGSNGDASSVTSQSGQREEGDVSAHASRMLGKGIGWLIGADDAT